jgi:hypothetical protein
MRVLAIEVSAMGMNAPDCRRDKQRPGQLVQHGQPEFDAAHHRGNAE